MASSDLTPGSMHEFRRCDDAAALARAVADHLGERIAAVLQEQPHCRVALPGGSTPALMLARLAELALPWDRVHWYLGDERCYPQGHAARNDVMLEQQLWSRIDAPLVNRHPMAAELGPEAAAVQYTGELSRAGPLDIIVLGMGEDGHTASLFPGNAALDDLRPVVPVFQAPKPPPERVTLGLVTLQAATERIVLVAGKAKAEALGRVQAGEPLPVSLIGPALWFVDAAAASETGR